MMKRRSQPRRSSPPPGPAKHKAAPPRRTRADHKTALHLLSVLRTGGDARITKIKRVRQKVRTRSYENELKLAIAIERMAGDLAG